MNKLITTTIVGLGTFFLAATSASAYTVKSGDTLSGIAKEHEVSLHNLIESNPQIENPNLIFPNQQINIPNASNSKSVTVEVNEPSGNKTVNQAISLSESEKDLLARLVRAEAQSEPYAGKVAVAKVVLNRVMDEDFPNTVESVIYQSGQFSPVRNGSINRPATEESRKAVDEAVNQINSGQTLGAVFFYNPRIATNGYWLDTRPTVTTIGNHVFKK